MFEYLASVGVAGFEFFQSTQNVNELGRQPTAAEIRSYLDNAGLVAQGTHQFGPANLDVQTGNLIAADPAGSPTAPGENLFAFLQTLGMKTMGFSGNLSNLSTLGDSVNPVTGAITYGFAARAQHVDRIGEILRDRGVQYFFHPEQDNYRFFDDPAHPALDTVHRIQWVMANTDPKLFGWEIDILHNWSGRVRFLNATTHQPDISVWALAQAEAEARHGLAHQGRLPEHRHRRERGPAARPRAAARRTSRRSCARRRSPTRSISGEGDLGAGPVAGHPNADPDEPGLQVHVREPEGPEPAQLHHRERQRPRPGDRPSRPGPLAAPRQGVAPRRCCPGA